MGLARRAPPQGRDVIRLGSLFTGYGGLDLAVTDVVDDVVTVWHAENDPAASAVLAHHFPDIPNHGDVTAIEWDQVEPVDILTGGFPCQDVSLAGQRAGLSLENRSGLWVHMAYAIERLRPSLVVIENVRGLLSVDAASDVERCPWCLGDRQGRSPLRALGAVLGDLADLRYDAIWRGVRASDVGAAHARFRVFILARPAVADTDHVRQQRDRTARDRRQRPPNRDLVASHAPRIGRRQGQPEPARPKGRSDVAERGDGARHIHWGRYGPAVERWERLTERLAPEPTFIGQRGTRQLSPRFVEWLMGLQGGYVSDVAGLSRNAQLRVLGNGVVWQQAAAAIRWLALRWGDQT